jgi:hypothetical protein
MVRKREKKELRRGDERRRGITKKKEENKAGREIEKERRTKKLSCVYDTYLADVNSSIIATANSKDNGGFTEWSKVRTKCRTKTCGNIFNK